MNRLFLAFLFVFAFCAPAADASTAKAFSEALNKAASLQELKMQHSASAHEKGIIPIQVKVASYIDAEQRSLPSLTKKCPVVRISSHYLLGSMACVGLSDYGTEYQYRGGGAEYEQVKHKVSRWVEAAFLDGQTIPQENIFASKKDKIFLVRIDPKNAELSKAVEPVPTVNLFVPKNPQTLKSVFEEVSLNREQVCLPGRTCANVEVAQVCNKTGCFSISWKLVDGDSGDPLFGFNPDNSTEEFLLGFNATDVKGVERKSGNNYHFFTPEMMKFVQKNVQKQSPSDWAQIKRKMVNEDYFAK